MDTYYIRSTIWHFQTRKFLFLDQWLHTLMENTVYVWPKKYLLGALAFNCKFLIHILMNNFLQIFFKLWKTMSLLVCNKPFSNCLQFRDFPTQFLQSESFVILQMIRDYSVTNCFATCLTSRHVWTHNRHLVERFENSIEHQGNIHLQHVCNWHCLVHFLKHHYFTHWQNKFG